MENPTQYGRRVAELEAQGLTRSDAQGVADTEGLDDSKPMDADAYVAAWLSRNLYVYNVTNCGPRTKREKGEKPWECDAWLCQFAKRGRQEGFEYFTGTGHRTKPRCDWMKPRAVAPPAASVLHSLILDSSAVGQSFESWCADYGYDSDSRKAEATYRACQENADKLARVFSRADLETLAIMLQDY